MLSIIDSEPPEIYRTAIHKFGGSSLSTAHRLNNVVTIIREQTNCQDYIVVSANGKVTDWLVALSLGERQVITKIAQYYTCLANEIFKNSSVWLTGFEKSLTELTNNALSQDEILAHGEIWSASLLVELLQQNNIGAEFVDARDIFKSDQVEDFQTFDIDYFKSGLKKSTYGNYTKRLVITGYIANGKSNQTVTLGRNGSDYSAALLAHFCNANSVTLWTDVEGIFSADPSLIATSKIAEFLSYQEANALASVGTGVLHQKTLSPLLVDKIPLFVRSSLSPQGKGTEVGLAMTESFNSNKADIKSIALKKDLVKLTVNLTQHYTKHQLVKLLATHHIDEVHTDSSLDNKQLTLVIEEVYLVRLLKLIEDCELTAKQDDSRYSVVAIVAQNITDKHLVVAQLKNYLNSELIYQLLAGEQRHLLYLLTQNSDGASLLDNVHSFYFQGLEAIQEDYSVNQQDIIEAVI